MEEAIADLVNNNVAVNAILGERFFPVRIPQSNKLFPASTYIRTGTKPTDSKDGVSSLDTFLGQLLFRIEGFSQENEGSA